VQPAGRLHWLASHAKDTLERASHHLSVSDWIGFRLCGVAAAEPSQAAETLLFELEAPRWAWDWIDRLGLPRRIFPEVRRAGSRLGALREDAAEQLGVSPGIPVSVGGGDPTGCSARAWPPLPAIAHSSPGARAGGPPARSQRAA
jgi:autoinducer 2 (AI-2) kinase